MKVTIDTIRYGIQSKLHYHCRSGSYDPGFAVLDMRGCWVEEDDGDRSYVAQQIVSVTAGDTITVEDCACPDHEDVVLTYPTY